MFFPFYDLLLNDHKSVSTMIPENDLSLIFFSLMKKIEAWYFLLYF